MTGPTVRRVLLLAAAALSLAAYGARASEHSESVRKARQPACDLAALGRAVAADTAALQKAKVDFPWEESTEGASMTAFTDAKEVRVLALSFFGERGRVVSSYYLTPTGDFVLVQEEMRYALPIDAELPPKIVSRLPAVAYYCAGSPQNALPDSDVVRAKGTLDSAFAVLRRSGH